MTLKESLNSNPYKHITRFPSELIKPGTLDKKGLGTQFDVYGDSLDYKDWIMTFESVSRQGDVVKICHLSIQANFRGQSLGKPCVEAFVAVLKNEFKVSKVIFFERLGDRGYYKSFFEQTLGATPCPEENTWELLV